MKALTVVLFVVLFIFTPAIYYSVHLDATIVRVFRLKQHHHVRMIRHFHLRKKCHDRNMSLSQLKHGYQLERELNQTALQDLLDTWVDEECTDNPPVPVDGSYLLHNLDINFDPSLQFRNLRQANHLFKPKQQSFQQINLAPQLMGHELGQNAQVFSTSTGELPIVIDTGASVTLSPIASDFVGPILPCKRTHLKGLSSQTSISGIGTVSWVIRDALGTIRRIETEAYFVPDASIRLFSPQKYFQESDRGHLYVDKDAVTFEIKDGTRLQFPYQDGSCLPMMLTDKHFEERELCVGLTFSDLMTLETIDNGYGLLNVAHDLNGNLTSAQRELKLLHDRLAHCDMQRIQELTVDRSANGEQQIIRPKNKTVSSCMRPQCLACNLSKQTRSPTGAHHQLPTATAGGIRSNDVEPGDGVSIDQYHSSVRGRLPNTAGKEAKSKKYTGGIIFYDHASQNVFVRHQVSLRVGETLNKKHEFEGYCKERGVSVKKYHTDNMPFNAQEFQDDCRLQNQQLEFSGVGAHHQNAVAERSIRTISSWTRTMLLHSILHWPDQANLELWPFAMEHAVYVWNHLPKKGVRLSPIEIFTKSKCADYAHLASLAVWGCPVYVLDPQLQDGKKLPKWKPRSRQGMYLGTSESHANTVGRILNVRTGYVSPQFHCVYDNLFTTVPSVENGGLFNDDNPFNESRWNELVQSGYEKRYELERDVNGNQLPGPILQDEWLTGQELQAQQERQRLRRWRIEHQPYVEPIQPNGPQQVPQPNNDAIPEGAIDNPLVDADANDNIEFEFDELDLNDDNVNRSILDMARQIEDQIDEEIERLRDLPPNQTRSGRMIKPPERLITTMIALKKHSSGQGRNYQFLGRQRVRNYLLNEQYLQCLDWSYKAKQNQNIRLQQMLITMEQDTHLFDNTCEALDPFVLSTMANAQDNPTWEEAMNGPDKQGYWKACEVEIGTLNEKNAWQVVDREDWMNVLPSTWAFKCKRYPDGSIRKLKARFCARGDRQIEGMDFFETFAPVVNWQTVRIMLVLSIILGLQTVQVDYTAAFVQAPIDRDPNWDQMTDEERQRSGVYLDMPRGFKESGKVLKLNQSLYGLRQSPRNFFLLLKENLEKVGLKQCDSDPCLFISKKVVCLVYVDDTLFYAKNQADIDEVIDNLRQCGMDLEKEEDVAGFLGVHINRKDDGTIELTQTGLIARIISALNLEDRHGKETPAEFGALPKDIGGETRNGTYNYASVIGMLLYLSGHSRPDITFAVSQCARFTHSPTRLHEKALERIGLYLKKTNKSGMVFKPNHDGLKLDCYCDADFAGLWGYEDRNDSTCVRSRTGFIFFLNECPVLWMSKLQTDIATSTMEAEYSALSTAMRELIPLKQKIEEISQEFNLGDLKTTKIVRTTVHEDNMGCLKLANLEPGRMTTRSKHYAIKYHWFRSHIRPQSIEIKHVETSQQRADLLTKSLRANKFRENRKLSMGW